MAEERAEDIEREEEDYGLDHETVDAILEAAEAGDAARLAERLEPLHPADIADLLEQVSGAERRSTLKWWAKCWT